MNENRQPRGIPVGGQFAAAQKSEAAVSLASSPEITDEVVARFAGEQNLAMAAATARKNGWGMVFHIRVSGDFGQMTLVRAFAEDTEGRMHDINGTYTFEKYSEGVDEDLEDLVGIHADHIEHEIDYYAQGQAEQDYDAAAAYSDAMVARNLEGKASFVFDAPDDGMRFHEAADFIREADIDGEVAPEFTSYMRGDRTDSIHLTVDDIVFTIHGAGGRDPELSYEPEDEGGWSFRTQKFSDPTRNEHETLNALVASARHDVACQKAWLTGEFSFTEGRNGARIEDFDVRCNSNGDRVITLDLKTDAARWTLRQAGKGDVQVFINGSDSPALIPSVALDAIAYEFDEEHDDGMGDLRFKLMMQEAADRAEAHTGFNAAHKER